MRTGFGVPGRPARGNASPVEMNCQLDAVLKSPTCCWELGRPSYPVETRVAQPALSPAALAISRSWRAGFGRSLRPSPRALLG